MRTVKNMKNLYNEFNAVREFFPVTSTSRPSVYTLDVDFLVDNVPGAVSAVSLPFVRDNRLAGVAVEFTIEDAPDAPATEVRIFIPNDKLRMMVDFR